MQFDWTLLNVSSVSTADSISTYLTIQVLGSPKLNECDQYTGSLLRYNPFSKNGHCTCFLLICILLCWVWLVVLENDEEEEVGSDEELVSMLST